MNEAKHTPGPWKICKQFPHQNFIEVEHGDKHTKGSGSLVIARVTCRTTWQEKQEANARLIAAAPEMLERLEMCKRFLEDMHTQSPEVTVAASQTLHETVSEIIAKATGGEA